MKDKFFVCMLLGAVLLGAMTGCKKDKPEPEPQPEPKIERIAVNLRADILPANTSNVAIVAKVANDQWETNDKVGLFMKRTGQALTTQGAIFNDANNVQMSIESGMLTTTPPLMYPETGKVDFIAYYPYTANVGADFTIPVNVAGQATGLPMEVLYSNSVSDQTPTASSVALNFLYSLAKVEITVTGGENSELTEADFAAMSVTVDGLYTQANLQLANGTFAGMQEKQTVTLRRKSNTATSATFEMLALPSNEQATFLFHVNNRVHSYEMTVDYKAARMYRYAFALDFPHTTLLNSYIVPRDEEPQQNISIAVPTPDFARMIVGEYCADTDVLGFQNLVIERVSPTEKVAVKMTLGVLDESAAQTVYPIYGILELSITATAGVYNLTGAANMLVIGWRVDGTESWRIDANFSITGTFNAITKNISLYMVSDHEQIPNFVVAGTTIGECDPPDPPDPQEVCEPDPGDNNYAAEVGGLYTGLFENEPLYIIMTRKNNHTVGVSVNFTLSDGWSVLVGPKTFTGDLTLNYDNENDRFRLCGKLGGLLYPPAGLNFIGTVNTEQSWVNPTTGEVRIRVDGNLPPAGTVYFTFTGSLSP